MRMKLPTLLTLALLFTAASVAQTDSTVIKKRRPLPYEFGRVVISANSQKADLAPVVFEHWVHRQYFTCRVCHVDIGFAMKANATNIKAIDNARGYYCGSCHDGKTIVAGKRLFMACSKKLTNEDESRCDRCHSQGKEVARAQDFFAFSKPLPKERFGNGIDWQQAEETGLINPSDFVKGISIPRKSMSIRQDFALSPKLAGMPDIIFSHKKHTVWNGCELCHPEIFVGVKKGLSHYTMASIFEGKSCGVCHNDVAFPLTDCQRCHSKPPQPGGQAIHAAEKEDR